MLVFRAGRLSCCATLVWFQLTKTAIGACDSATGGDYFAGVKWLAWTLGILVIPIGLVLLFYGLPLQRHTRGIFGGTLGLLFAAYLCLNFVDKDTIWALPIVVLPVSVLFGKLSVTYPKFGVTMIGFIFGGFVAFSAIVCGLYVLYDGVLWPTQIIVVFVSLFFASIIRIARRRRKGFILGRLQLIPLYTSLIGAIGVIQPINYLTYNNMHAWMVVDCDQLPDVSVYIYLCLVYAVAGIGVFYQVRFGERIQREYFQRKQDFGEVESRKPPSRREKLLIFIDVALHVPLRTQEPSLPRIPSLKPTVQLQPRTNHAVKGHDFWVGRPRSAQTDEENDSKNLPHHRPLENDQSSSQPSLSGRSCDVDETSSVPGSEWDNNQATSSGTVPERLHDSESEIV